MKRGLSSIWLNIGKFFGLLLLLFASNANCSRLPEGPDTLDDRNRAHNISIEHREISIVEAVRKFKLLDVDARFFDYARYKELCGSKKILDILLQQCEDMTPLLPNGIIVRYHHRVVAFGGRPDITVGDVATLCLIEEIASIIPTAAPLSDRTKASLYFFRLTDAEGISRKRLLTRIVKTVLSFKEKSGGNRRDFHKSLLRMMRSSSRDEVISAFLFLLLYPLQGFSQSVKWQVDDEGNFVLRPKMLSSVRGKFILSPKRLLYASSSE